MTMKSVFRASLLILIVTFATQLAASTLSVIPLGEALQNPDLMDPESEGHDAALEAVSSLLANRPEPESDELREFRTRLADLASHRETRVGKLFFGALAATPEIENLPDDVTQAGINALWPLALGSSIRVRAEFRKVDNAWLIAEFELTVDGLAGAPVAGMAPYFGKGEIRPLLLDLDAIDYVVGRDAEDRRRPELERKPFDYDDTLKDIFAAEENGVAGLIDTLNEKVTSKASPEERRVALLPHLATQPEKEALKKGGDDPEFWADIFEQLKIMGKLARPAAMPKREGAQLRISWTSEGEPRLMLAYRLADGNIALRDRPLNAPTRGN